MSSTTTTEESLPTKIEDEEKSFLLPEETDNPEPPLPPPKQRTALSRKFWFSSAVNASSTAAIIFVNKRIFTDPSLRRCQVTFAAFHFAVTALLLYTVSRPAIALFPAKPLRPVQMLPLALAMIFNVVLPNASLAFSSIQFYQVVRVLLTPIVALLNYMMSAATIPARAAWTLVPVCVGVGFVSYFDTQPKAGADDGGQGRGTSPVGAVFAFTGVFASALYTVLIGRYHKVLECTSMQLLLNQAPVSVVLMLYVIPFSDDITVWRVVDVEHWMLILLSGVLACLINLTQFVIVNEAGPVSSTVVGHFKTCSIIGLGWVYSGKSVKDTSLLGIVLAVGGIISYSFVMHRHARK